MDSPGKEQNEANNPCETIKRSRLMFTQYIRCWATLTSAFLLRVLVGVCASDPFTEINLEDAAHSEPSTTPPENPSPVLPSLFPWSAPMQSEKGQDSKCVDNQPAFCELANKQSRLGEMIGKKRQKHSPQSVVSYSALAINWPSCGCLSKILKANCYKNCQTIVC